MNRSQLEKHVLSALLYEHVKHPDWVAKLRPEYFREFKHRVAFEALTELLDSGREFDAAAYTDLIEAKICKASDLVNQLTSWERLPGEDERYLYTLREKGLRDVFAAQAEAFAELVKGKAKRDSVKAALLDLCEFELDPNPPRQEQIYEQAEETINEDQLFGTGFIDLGLPSLEDYYPARDYLTVIAARPSVGKTMLALNLAENLGKRGLEPLFYSLEMSDISLIRRRAAMAVGVELSKMRRVGGLTKEELAGVARALTSMKASRVHLHAGSMTAGKLISAIVSEKRQNDKIRSVFIDHLGLVGFSGKGDSKHYLEVGKFTTRLARVCKDYQLAVFLLTQLNRPSEGRNGFTLDRLAESGKIEQDADMVWMLDRRDDAVTVHVLKNRDGPIGKADLECDPKTGRVLA